MGLDITAYRGLKKIENPEFDEYGYLKNYDTNWLPGESMKWSESHWPGRGYPIDYKTVYAWLDSFEFYAGSYSGYNRWRDHLYRFKGKEAFQELIHFADNEGVIGTEVSKKLRDDFLRFHDEAEIYFKSLSAPINYYFELYEEWEKAFEYAADSGAVDFH